MPDYPDELVRRLTEPPSPDVLQRVARELYEVEPLDYGNGPVPWDSPLLSNDARSKCAVYAGAIIAAWQRAMLGDQR